MMRICNSTFSSSDKTVRSCRNLLKQAHLAQAQLAHCFVFLSRAKTFVVGHFAKFWQQEACVMTDKAAPAHSDDR